MGIWGKEAHHLYPRAAGTGVHKCMQLRRLARLAKGGGSGVVGHQAVYGWQALASQGRNVRVDMIDKTQQGVRAQVSMALRALAGGACC